MSKSHSLAFSSVATVPIHQNREMYTGQAELGLQKGSETHLSFMTAFLPVLTRLKKAIAFNCQTFSCIGANDRDVAINFRSLA
jgi:hypothetical protein